MSKLYNKVNLYARVRTGSDKLLAITTEYRKGILFVRLEGSLINSTISLLNNELNEWLGAGINNVVFNLQELDTIDALGIQSFFNYYQMINGINGHSLICGINQKLNNCFRSTEILNYIYEISDELSAIKVMKWRSWS